MDLNSSQVSAALSLPAIKDSNGFRWWVLIVPFLSIVFLFGCYAMVNGDIWWHLKAGEIILKTHRIPTDNMFTYTNPTSVWIDLHWGFQCFVAIIYNQFGAFGLICAKSLIACTTFLLLLLTSRNSLPAWVTLLCWTPFLHIFAARYHVRPEMFSLLFVASTIWILHHCRQRPSQLWLLIPLQIAWVNVQGLFVLQHLVVGAFLLQELIVFLNKRNNLQLLRRILVVFILTVMASFLNPYGLQGALFPLELMGKMSGEQRDFFQTLAGETSGISEFIERYGVLAITTNSTTLTLFATAFGVIISQLVSSIYRRRLDIVHWCLLGGFAYLAWQMNRNSNLYALIFGYILCSNIANIIEFNRLSNFIPDESTSDSRHHQLVLPRHLLSAVRFAALFITVGVLCSTINDAINHREQNPGQLPRRIYFSDEHPWYNQSAAKFISKIPAPLNVYARHQGTGFAGVVIYYCFDQQAKYSKRVYADARLEANSLRVLQEFESIPKLLENDMRAAEALLVGEDGKLPLLVLGNGDLMRRPRLLRSLIASEQWQCIYVSEIDLQSSDFGVSMFMPSHQRKSIGLRRVSVEPLLQSIYGQ